MAEKSISNQRLRVSIFIPLIFVCLLWIAFIAEISLSPDYITYGVYPRTITGLRGILLMPFIHADWDHLISNSVPLLILGFALTYFYQTIAYKIFFQIWLYDGLGVWLTGREAYHIGASGIVYGIASFIFFSGILRKNRSLLTVSLIVAFTYGGMVWGMFPYLEQISWEGHLIGFLCGMALSFFYLKKGPPDDPIPQWMSEEQPEVIFIPDEENLTAPNTNDLK